MKMFLNGYLLDTRKILHVTVGPAAAINDDSNRGISLRPVTQNRIAGAPSSRVFSPRRNPISGEGRLAKKLLQG